MTEMVMPADSFLRLKGRTSYFRRKIPAALQTQLASSEICLRLGVIDRDSAVQLGRRLAVAVDAFFVSARRNKMLSSQHLTALLGSALQEWRATIQPVPVPLVSTREQAKTMASLADGLLHRQSDGYPMVDDAFIAAQFGATGIEVPTDPMAMRLAGNVLTAGMAAHYLETAAELARQGGLDRGLFKLPAAEWEEKAFRLVAPYGDVEEASAASPKRESLSQAPVRPTRSAIPASAPMPTAPGGVSTKFAREAGATLSTQANYIVSERVKAKQVGPDAVRNLGPSLRLWLQICGDADVRAYSAQHMAEFRSVLIDIPKVYWRSAGEQAKNILQVIVEAGAKGPDYVRVSPKTVNKHISNLNSVFEYAKTMGLIERSHASFAEGLYLETGSEVSGLEENEERPGYTPDQVQLFFTHPVYQGRKSEYFYNDPGQVIVRDALYWLPLLACFQLMRREEICQLKVKHVRQDQSIWYFDLMHHEVKVKRHSSKRRVPVHDSIIKLSFLEEVVHGREPEELLFPELVPNAKGSHSDAVGKRVSRMVDSLGIKLVRVDDTEADGALHPFRHHGITQLENQGIQGGIIDALSGHSSNDRKSERRRYTDEIYLKVLRDTINKLHIPVDPNALNGKWRASRQEDRP
ncbi:site-specific integrase [Devosia sp.]|uniref:site-specific integrase n=1 Tax=Devosia sp. TaxID=1871048 RepID=UPI002FC967F2